MNMNNVNILKFESQLTTITPEMAEQMITDCHYKFQRPARQRNVEQMSVAMARNEFPITTLTLCDSLELNRTDVLDGYHRLLAAKAGKHSFRANVQRMTVATEEDKKALWLYIDAVVAVRTARDYRPLIGSELVGMNGSARSSLERASTIIANRFSGNFLSGRDRKKVPLGIRLDIMEQYVSHAHTYTAAIKGASSAIASPISSGCLYALGCVIIESKPEIGVPFFESIAANSGLTAPDPRHLFFEVLARPHTLRNELLRTMQRLAMCWNSHLAKEGRQTFGRLGAGIVVPIDGTEYTIGA